MATKFDDQFRAQSENARNRALLMNAAVKLFAREGFEAVSADDITGLAGVDRTSFDAHFRSVDEIAAAVAFGMAEQVAQRLAESMVDVEDAVERVCLGTRWFVDLACSHPDWGAALIRAVAVFRQLHEGVSAYARADIQRGVDQGVFTIRIDDVLIDTFTSMAINTVTGRLRGDYAREAGSQVAELQLRMLGVDPAMAAEVAWREIPVLKIEMTGG